MKKTSLKEQKKSLEEGIKWEQNMIKNNKSYTGPNGKTYGPDHYKKAIKYDVEELKNVNNKLDMQAKVNSLKKAAGKLPSSSKKDEIKNGKKIFKKNK